jgi:hypothetical protein
MMDWAACAFAKRLEAPAAAEINVMTKVDVGSDLFKYWDGVFKRRTGRHLFRPIDNSFYLPPSPEGDRRLLIVTCPAGKDVVSSSSDVPCPYHKDTQFEVACDEPIHDWRGVPAS